MRRLQKARGLQCSPRDPHRPSHRARSVGHDAMRLRLSPGPRSGQSCHATLWVQSRHRRRPSTAQQWLQLSREGGTKLPHLGLIQTLGSQRSGSPLLSPAQAAKNNAESSLLTVPTILTLCRVAALPVLLLGALAGRLHELASLWAHSTESSAAWYLQSGTPIVCALIFLAACFTDWLDGYLARAWVSSPVLCLLLEGHASLTSAPGCKHSFWRLP